MKARLALLAILLVLTVVIVWHVDHPAPPATPVVIPKPTPGPDTAPVPAMAPATPDATVTPEAPVGSGPAVPVASRSAPPPVVAPEMEVVKMLIRDFRASLGGNPVGSNAEIARALQGDNPRRTRFLAGDEAPVNAKGELIDHWGTPYFFHQISAHEMEIRSAGPDRKMWTDDDILIR